MFLFFRSGRANRGVDLALAAELKSHKVQVGGLVGIPSKIYSIGYPSQFACFHLSGLCLEA